MEPGGNSSNSSNTSSGTIAAASGPSVGKVEDQVFKMLVDKSATFLRTEPWVTVFLERLRRSYAALDPPRPVNINRATTDDGFDETYAQTRQSVNDYIIPSKTSVSVQDTRLMLVLNAVWESTQRHYSHLTLTNVEWILFNVEMLCQNERQFIRIFQACAERAVKEGHLSEENFAMLNNFERFPTEIVARQ